MSIRDRILAAEDIPVELVDVPEWGVSILVKGMTGADRGLLMEEAIDPATGEVNLQVIYPDAVILTSHDPETGARIFSTEDRAALLSKSGLAIDRVATVAMKLSGFEDKAVDKAGKDSSKTPGVDTSST
jgi:hypothetical protein